MPILLVDKTYVDQMNSEELERFANAQCTEILRQLDETINKIYRFQGKIEDYPDLNAWEHVTNLLLAGKVKTGKDIQNIKMELDNMRADSSSAMISLVTVLQESVMFTCTTAKLSQAISRVMQEKMTQGFINKDGNICKLSEKTRQYVRYLIQQADLFSANQIEFDQRVKELEQFKKNIEDYEKNQELRIKAGEEKDEEQDKIIRDRIYKDLEHDKAILEVKEKITEQSQTITNQINKVSEQDKVIVGVKEKISEQSQLIDDHAKKNADQDNLIHEQIRINQEQEAAIVLGKEHDEKQDAELENQKELNAEQEKAIYELENQLSNLKNEISSLKGRIDAVNTKTTMIYFAMVLGGISIILSIIHFFI